jgi:selT/selW/selH-like putative selenoprotein
VAAELEKAFGVQSELIPGSGGVFTVTVDGRVVYSKAETGGFPEPGEAAKAAGGG